MNESHFLKSLQFCVIDLEATGGVIGRDEIIEIGLVQIDGLEITKTLQYKIKPDKPIPKFVQKLTSLTPDKLKNAPKIYEVIDEVIDFIGDRIIVAHNTAFDIPFLNGVLKKLERKQLKNHSICTHVMTKYLLPESVSSNLAYLASIFNIELKPHRALEDAKATAHLLLKYLDIFNRKGIKKLNHIYYPQNKFELDRIHITRENQKDLDSLLSDNDHIAYLVIKDEQGSMISCFIKTQSNQALITETLNNLDWSRITFYLTGTLFESLRRINLHFFKMPQEARDLSLELLEKSIENNEKSPLTEDYILIPHIISGQYTLYDLHDLHPSKRLILKYPGHEKKLVHFLKSSQRKKGKKKAKIQQPISQELAPYFYSLSNKNSLLFKSQDIEEAKAFFGKMKNEMISSHQLFNFPDKYL